MRLNLLPTAILISALAISASGQASRVPPAPGRHPAAGLPRTPWGHPDIQGRWSNATLTPLERPAALGGKEFFTPEEAAEYAKTALETYLEQANLTAETELAAETTPELWGEPRTIVPTGRTSLIVGPTGRLPALTPEARQRFAARPPAGPVGRMDSYEDRPLNERCLWFSSEGPALLPSITYNSNYQIVQTPTHVAILAEMGGGLRIIPLDGRPHLPSAVTRWLGDSRGRWDGDTLVVETTNVSPKREWRGSSSGLRLVERFQRAPDGLLLYQFTATDPATWVEPWSAEIPMTTLDGLLYEYACHEGNRSLEYVLRAARKADVK